MDEKELYAWKAALLKKALKRAEELDAEGAHGVKLRPVYELEPGQELKDDECDGMEELLGDDVCETDWNLEDGVPPPGFWRGTHDRFGKRRLGAPGAPGDVLDILTFEAISLHLHCPAPDSNLTSSGDRF